jgi:hypothetical protein
MDSAFECFQQAAKCELLAANSEQGTWRIALLAEAKNWRRLGSEVKTRQAAEISAKPVESYSHSATPLTK